MLSDLFAATRCSAAAAKTAQIFICSAAHACKTHACLLHANVCMQTHACKRMHANACMQNTCKAHAFKRMHEERIRAKRKHGNACFCMRRMHACNAHALLHAPVHACAFLQVHACMHACMHLDMHACMHACRVKSALGAPRCLL